MRVIVRCIKHIVVTTRESNLYILSKTKQINQNYACTQTSLTTFNLSDYIPFSQIITILNYAFQSDYHNQVHLNDTGGYLVRVDIGEGVFVYVRLSIYPQIQSPPINLSIMAVHDNSSQKQYGMDKFKRIRFAHQLLLLFIKCMWGFFFYSTYSMALTNS